MWWDAFPKAQPPLRPRKYAPRFSWGVFLTPYCLSPAPQAEPQAAGFSAGLSAGAEADGIITRTVYPEVPPRVEYALSDLGESMRPIMDAMAAWGINYKKSME